MPELNTSPSIIDVPGGKVIAEHVGRVATGSEAMSVAHMKAPRDWSEPAQRPDFDEVTVVVSGTVLVEHDAGTTEVTAGQSIVTRAGERVRYSTGPEGAEYVAICTPAFAPDTVHREDEG
ncbi:cupin [Janibacter sp. Soil728]|uniref:cupin domain-containing protein n=1 Tax=Janibacter sp. Soil728 TaxID=1736393 RepID=UPI0006FE7ACC|nr:cupin [Janibacter sp. Soil728]KRE37624.1 cupin [Janibacter sp. Soil728]